MHSLPTPQLQWKAGQIQDRQASKLQSRPVGDVHSPHITPECQMGIGLVNELASCATSPTSFMLSLVITFQIANK